MNDYCFSCFVEFWAKITPKMRHKITSFFELRLKKNTFWVLWVEHEHIVTCAKKHTYLLGVVIELYDGWVKQVFNASPKAELQLGEQRPSPSSCQVQAVPPLPHRDGPDLSHPPLAWQETEGRLCWQGLKNTKTRKHKIMANRYSIGKSENKCTFFFRTNTNRCVQ